MESPQLKADYIEKIEIQPEDIIPKSAQLKCIKFILITVLMLMTIIAIIAIIVAESYLERSYLSVGIISLVGIILFFFGLISIAKEHVPSILIFAVSMIFYLLVLMYSRVFDSAGWIITRNIFLMILILGAILYCILLRDWRQLQVSRLRQRAIKDVQYGVPVVASNYNGLTVPQPAINNPYVMGNNRFSQHQYEHIENPYTLIAPSSSYTPTPRVTRSHYK